MSKKIEDPDQIEKFSLLFLSDVKRTLLIPERIPNGVNRNIVLFISTGKTPLAEWHLFKLESGWWFMKKWTTPENKKGEFTEFLKCGDKMEKYLDCLVSST